MIFDDNFFIPALTTITSLLENTKLQKITINVITTGISEDNVLILKSVEKKYDIKIIIHLKSVSDYQSIYQQYDGNTGAGSIIALLKFDLWNILPEDYILYLDSDLIIKRDISELFDIDLESNYAAVVEDSGTLYNMSGLRSSIKNYFNSGVLLLNGRQLRKDQLTNKLIEIKRSLEDHTLVDQNAFNIAFDGNVICLPIKYNCLAINLFNSASRFDIRDLNQKYSTNYSCIYSIVDDASIIHYASKEKPWLFEYVPFIDYWNYYFKKSPCSDMPLSREKGEDYQFTEIPIMLATDDNYTPQTGVTIISALENRIRDVFYSFYIFTASEFGIETLAKFHQIEEKYPKCSIICLKMDDNLFSDVKLNISHITRPTFYRLVAASKLPQYEKIIYLDSDVIVEQDLSEYFNFNLSGYYVAGVKGASYHWPADGNKAYCKENGLPAIDQYVNAGVLLFNLSNIRLDNVEEEFIKLSKLGLRSQDQDVINRACYNKILHLPYKYNCMVAKYEKTPKQLLKVFDQAQINEANNCPTIIHYAAEKKPWADLSCALADRWWKYAYGSPYYGEMIEKNRMKLLDNGVFNRFLLNNSTKSISTMMLYPSISNFYSPNNLVKKLRSIIFKKKACIGGSSTMVINYKELDELWKSGDEKQYKKLFKTCLELIDSNDPQIFGRLARLYRDGKGVEKNLDKALSYMRIAAFRNISWAKGEYVDILISLKDPLANAEAFSYCYENANDDNPVIECRLSRLYRNGLGTVKNIDKAISWMSRAVISNEGWSGEYVDMLLSTKNSNYWSAAFDIVSKQSDKNPDMMYRLSLMYKQGKGVDKDYSQYEYFVNKAAKNGSNKAIRELDKN